MADVKISGLPASTTPLAGTEVLPIVQSGVTKKVAVSDLTAARNVSANTLAITNGAAAFSPAAGVGVAVSGAYQRGWTTPGTLSSPAEEAALGYGSANGAPSSGIFFNNTYSEQDSSWPSFKIAFNGTPYVAARFDTGGNFTLPLGNLVIGTSGKGINTSSAIPVTFNINSVEAARIHASGGVSIGNTTDPGATNLSVTGSVKSGTLTSGRVTYAGASGLLTDTSTFVFDGTNLGIGLTTPTSYAGYTGVTLLGGAAGAFLDLDNNLNTARFQLFTYAGATALNTINTNALTFGTQNTERMRVHASGGVSIGNTTDSGAASLNVSGLIFPQQAATASAPAYQKGAIYFDTTLNKLRVGGATDWETITSV